MEPNIEVLNWLVDCRPEVFESLRSAGPQEVFEKLEANDFDDWADVQTTTHCSPRFLSLLQQVVRKEEAELHAEMRRRPGDGFSMVGEYARHRRALWNNGEDNFDGADEDASGFSGEVSVDPWWEPVLRDSQWKPDHVELPALEPRPSFFVPKQREIIFDKQKSVGKRIFEKMEAHFGTGGLSSRFERFSFFIMLPMFNTLQAQTEGRLRQFLNHFRAQVGDEFFPELAGGDAIQTRIFKASKTSENTVKRMKREIQEDEKRLVLFIHDEAHYAVTARGAVHDFLNHHDIREAPNVVQLLVSATPYLLQTGDSQIPIANEIDWMENSHEAEESQYYGLQRFHNESEARDSKAHGGVIKGDPEFENHCKRAARMPRADGGKHMMNARRDALIEEYIWAMMHNQRVPEIPKGWQASRCTQTIVNDLLEFRPDGSGIMVLIRVALEDGVRDGTKIKRQLEAARDALGLKDRFAVILDVNTRSRSDWTTALGPSMLERLKMWNRHPGNSRFEMDDLSHPASLSYEHLLDLPVVLILCEKGKMGDTFPKSMRHYDLRLRYSNSCEIRAATEQDLGRAFRYGPEEKEYPFPTVLVGPRCARELLARGRGELLLRLKPDYSLKMRIRYEAGSQRVLEDDKKKDAAFPKSSLEASKVYRKYWTAGQNHYDLHKLGPCNSRFLLQGGSPP
jgi:hypothetical protein